MYRMRRPPSSSAAAQPASSSVCGGKSLLSALLDITLCGVVAIVVGGFVLLALVDVDGGGGGFDPNAAIRARAARRRRAAELGVDEEALPAAEPSWPQPFKAIVRPSPSGVPPRPEVYDTRGCTCVDDWKARKGKGDGKDALCTCMGEACPPDVDPVYLTEAEGQDVCSLYKHTGYGCTAGCRAGKVYWYGFSCGKDGEKPCPPLLVTPSPTPSGTPTPPPPIVVPKVTWDPKAVVDLHGVVCEILEGREVCFNEDTQGRTLCPSYVTSAYLRDPRTDGPHPVPAEIVRICADPAFAEQFYCSVFCQDGNDHVQWWTHDVNWCYSKDGKGACPSRHPVVNVPDFTVKPWSEQGPPDTPCQAAFKDGQRPTGLVEGLTVGMLTHEPVAFSRTLVSYEIRGFFDVVPEFLVYMNNRHAGLEAVLKPYMDKYPGKIRILGDASNVGIARGITYMTGNATQPYFLLLERDFWLIEPATCAEEQLRAGIDLLKTGAVHVVRYRSQRHAGRPNWAENFFLGHEHDAFVGRQPNLACNIHYWVWDIAERWPEYFWKCGEDPTMICSDSFYCNWTNNPQLWEIAWWNREYVERFDKFKRNDPWYDLESYMNWEPHSWNDRGFVVAQGDGLFKHIDPTKF